MIGLDQTHRDGGVARPLGDLLLSGRALPSFSSWIAGTAVCRSWKMIDAVMYGMMPRPKIVDWLNEPPEKIDA